jgi:hypothetical protein
MKRITQTRKVSKEQRQKQREKTKGARNLISKAVFIEHIWDPSIFLCFETLKQLKDFFGYKSMSKITSVVKNQRQGGNVIKKYWKVITYPTKYAKELLHNNNL